MQRLPLLLVTAAHFLVDSYATMLAPVLPLVIDRLGLSLTGAGVLGTIISACNLSQPLLGIWADGMRRRWLVLAGLALAALFTPLMGVAPSYALVVASLCAGGVGVSAFHPQAFSLAGELSGERRAFGLALFIFGGTLGLGVTPLWVPLFAGHLGLEYLPLVALPGVALLVLLLRRLPLDNPQLSGPTTAPGGGLGHAVWPLALITVIVVLRSVTAIGFGFFLAVLSKERGLSLVEGGVPLAVYNTAGVVGGLAMGYAADRVNPKPLIWGSLLLSTPALLAFLRTEGPASYLLLALGGALVLASNSVLVALAQDLAPGRSGLASSLPLGFSWGLASLTLGPVGWAADRIGVAATLEWLALLPVVPAAVALLLPRQPGAPLRAPAMAARPVPGLVPSAD